MEERGSLSMVPEENDSEEEAVRPVNCQWGMAINPCGFQPLASPNLISIYIVFKSSPNGGFMAVFNILMGFLFFPIRYEMIINDIPCFDAP